jgi:hypothetical protein
MAWKQGLSKEIEEQGKKLKLWVRRKKAGLNRREVFRRRAEAGAGSGLVIG